MAINAGYFGNDFNFEQRYFDDIEKLVEEVARLRSLKLKIVLTSGSYDLLHIGHARYLREAKNLGDVLIVGVESDEKVRSRKKGSLRPVVPLNERAEMLAHLRYIDIITVKNLDDPQWNLIKRIQPDVLQAVEGTYSRTDLQALKKFCGKIIVQPRQAETSTSAKIRLLVIEGMNNIVKYFCDHLPEFVTKYYSEKVAEMNEEFRSELPGFLEQASKELQEKESL